MIEFSFDANKYFNDKEPWKVKKIDKEKMNAIMYTIIKQIKNISILLFPIMPLATTKVLKSLHIDIDQIKISNIKNENVFNTQKDLLKPGILFNKVKNDN